MVRRYSRALLLGSRLIRTRWRASSQLDELGRSTSSKGMLPKELECELTVDTGDRSCVDQRKK